MESKESKYYRTHKEESKERRRLKREEAKLKSLKDELAKVDATFDITLNPYVKSFPRAFIQPYFKKLNKHFELIYDIEHFPRTLDSEAHLKEREKFRSEQRKEWDLKNRIIKWRLFRKAIAARKNREPTRTEAIFNNVCQPKEIIRENEEYRLDLMYLTQIQADDPYISVTTAEDWAREDEEDNLLHPEDYVVNLADYPDSN